MATKDDIRDMAQSYLDIRADGDPASMQEYVDYMTKESPEVRELVKREIAVLRNAPPAPEVPEIQYAVPKLAKEYVETYESKDSSRMRDLTARLTTLPKPIKDQIWSQIKEIRARQAAGGPAPDPVREAELRTKVFEPESRVSALSDDYKDFVSRRKAAMQEQYRKDIEAGRTIWNEPVNPRDPSGPGKPARIRNLPLTGEWNKIPPRTPESFMKHAKPGDPFSGISAYYDHYDPFTGPFAEDSMGSAIPWQSRPIIGEGTNAVPHLEKLAHDIAVAEFEGDTAPGNKIRDAFRGFNVGGTRMSPEREVKLGYIDKRASDLLKDLDEHELRRSGFNPNEERLNDYLTDKTMREFDRTLPPPVPEPEMVTTGRVTALPPREGYNPVPIADQVRMEALSGPRRPLDPKPSFKEFSAGIDPEGEARYKLARAKRAPALDSVASSLASDVPEYKQAAETFLPRLPVQDIKYVRRKAADIQRSKPAPTVVAPPEYSTEIVKRSGAPGLEVRGLSGLPNEYYIHEDALPTLMEPKVRSNLKFRPIQEYGGLPTDPEARLVEQTRVHGHLYAPDTAGAPVEIPVFRSRETAALRQASDIHADELTRKYIEAASSPIDKEVKLSEINREVLSAPKDVQAKFATSLQHRVKAGDLEAAKTHRQRVEDSQRRRTREQVQEYERDYNPLISERAGIPESRAFAEDIIRRRREAGPEFAEAAEAMVPKYRGAAAREQDPKRQAQLEMKASFVRGVDRAAASMEDYLEKRNVRQEAVVKMGGEAGLPEGLKAASVKASGLDTGVREVGYGKNKKVWKGVEPSTLVTTPAPEFHAEGPTTTRSPDVSASGKKRLFPRTDVKMTGGPKKLTRTEAQQVRNESIAGVERAERQVKGISRAAAAERRARFLARQQLRDYETPDRSGDMPEDVAEYDMQQDYSDYGPDEQRSVIDLRNMPEPPEEGRVDMPDDLHYEEGESDPRSRSVEFEERLGYDPVEERSSYGGVEEPSTRRRGGRATVGGLGGLLGAVAAGALTHSLMNRNKPKER